MSASDATHGICDKRRQDRRVQKKQSETAIAKAHLLLAEGWSVHIIDEQRRTFAPAEFHCLLASHTE
jgi:hypothetical protein